MENLTINIKASPANPDITILETSGELDIQTIPIINKAISQLFSENKYKLILDLSKLSYTNSAGVGIIIDSIKKARNHNGEILVTNASDDIKYIFDLLGFSKIYKTYTSIDSALKILS